VTRSADQKIAYRLEWVGTRRRTTAVGDFAVRLQLAETGSLSIYKAAIAAPELHRWLSRHAAIR
jgi:hypothetical protein